jgi:hypothetical protein
MCLPFAFTFFVVSFFLFSFDFLFLISSKNFLESRTVEIWSSSFSMTSVKSLGFCSTIYTGA